jgi:hypothetical protein
MPVAKQMIVDSKKTKRKRKPFLSDDSFDGYEEGYGEKALWLWHNGDLKMSIPQIREADGLINMQLDECIVPAQPSSNKKDIWVYTGVISANERVYYFTADSSSKLFYQVGALLAVLGVHKGGRELSIVADGAKWIRKYYKELPITRKELVLCFYHLSQTVHDLLTSAFGYSLGLALESKCMKCLWQGNVMAAIDAIGARANDVISKPKYRRIIRYLKARIFMIPNYQMRRSLGQYIANTRVEQFNNWSVANRCKSNGSSWGSAGVKAVAVLVAAERNGELNYWREHGELPSWQSNSSSHLETFETAQQSDYHLME